MNWTLWQIATAIRAVYGVAVNLTAHSYKAPHSKKLWSYPYVKCHIADTYELTLWQIATAIRAVYGVAVNLTAHSYKAIHSEKLWGYPYVKYPLANIYQADPMADSHTYQSSVWSEPYGTQLQSTPQQKAMGLSVCQVPRSKHL